MATLPEPADRNAAVPQPIVRSGGPSRPPAVRDEVTRPEGLNSCLPRIKSGVLLAPVEDGYVAYDPVLDHLHHLNPVAALIAELCDGKRTLSDISRIIETLTPSAKQPEIEQWIQEALDAGLLSLDASAGHCREFSAQELCSIAARLWQNGKIQTAFLCQQRAAELEAGDPDIWYSLGELAHIVGRRADARRAYERYSELEPGDAEIGHLLTALRDEAPPARVSDDCIRQLYHRFSSFYESNVRDELDYQGPRRIRELMHDVTDGRRGMATLDLGCGSGLAGVEMRPFSAWMAGVDLSPDMVKLARSRNIYDALDVAEITSWLDQPRKPFDVPFDVIVACDTLIYFGNLGQVLTPAAHLLGEGGVFAFSLERGDRRPFHLTDSGRYTHHPDHVLEAAADAGLSVLRMEEGFLRMEYGNDVTGLFVALGR